LVSDYYARGPRAAKHVNKRKSFVSGQKPALKTEKKRKTSCQKKKVRPCEKKVPGEENLLEVPRGTPRGVSSGRGHNVD